MIFDFDKNMVKRYLEDVSTVPFIVELCNEESFSIGEGDPLFKVKVNRPIKKADLLRSTSLTLGEAYMDHGIEIEGDVFEALNLVMSQANKFEIDSKMLNKFCHMSSSIKDQKKQVTSHYNIGNDFYSLWLGSTMNYSCAYFETEDDTLDQAQVNKTNYILRKLDLKEGMTLLDIGCGWGNVLIEAAKQYKAYGVGITLSEEQAKGFNQRIKEESLQDYIEVQIMDYRKLKDLNCRFDRVVSVGMLEHVGKKNYGLFMKTVDQMLKENGLFLLHYISSLQEDDDDPWIEKYIFPGGHIPSLREILHICGDQQFCTLDVESLRMHYVKTLLCWYQKYKAAEAQIVDMFDDEFIRMWEIYLCACAASFNKGRLDLHQVLLSKGPKNDLPLTRANLYR